MPAAASLTRTDAVRFALRGVGWSLGLFALLRLGWVEAHAVMPFTRIQGWVAAGVFGPSALPIEVTLACSGADALALCVGAVLAYPVPWPIRWGGALGGVALIVALNTIRIGTLGRAVASPAWFASLHLYIWPGLLTLGIAAYVFIWMRTADSAFARSASTFARSASVDRQSLGGGWLGRTDQHGGRDDGVAPATVPAVPRLMRRFVLLTAVFLVIFVAASPLYLQSAGVLVVAALIARAAAVLLSGVGLSAHAMGNVLWTSRGGFLVTQECITTPLLPVYLAAVAACSTTWFQRVALASAALPLFIALGIARLLVVAIPDTIVSAPLFFVHAFYQLLLGAVIVFIAAHWRHRSRAATGYAVAGVMVAILFVTLLGGAYLRLVAYPTGAPLLDDSQGAMALLPAFQVGLFLALWVAAFLGVGWKRFVGGIALLGVTQVAGLFAVHAFVQPSWLMTHVPEIRGWAVVGPLLIVGLVVNVAAPRR